MVRGYDPRHERSVHAQEAVVRALTEELSHVNPETSRAAALRTQLVEEYGRLMFHIAQGRPEENRSLHPEGARVPLPRDIEAIQRAVRAALANPEATAPRKHP